MKLYHMPGACSLASHIAPIWAGIPFELAWLDHETVHGPDFLRLNPKGSVPALETDGGEVVTESLAVLLYIADLSPASRLGAGGDPLERARLNEILAELVSEVHKAYGPTFVPGRYVSEDGAQPGAKQAAYRQIDANFARLERRMEDREWAALDRRTVADAYLHVMCRWKDRTPTPLARYPALAAHNARLGADDGVRRALREEGTGGG